MHTPASVNTPVSIKTPSSVKIVRFAEEAEVQGGGKTEAVTKDPSGEQGEIEPPATKSLFFSSVSYPRVVLTVHYNAIADPGG